MGNRLTGKGDDRTADRAGAPRMSATGRPAVPEEAERRRLRETKAQKAGPGRGAPAQSDAPQWARRRSGAAKAGQERAGRGAAGQPAPRTGRTILAAGAVLWLPGREKKKGKGLRRPRIAVIHRPKYDDWSLPKGKLDPGESMTQAALREVEEETGMRCVLGAELPAQHYLAQGRPKEVRYWAAVPTGGAFTPNREVDRLEWLSARKARARLTHDRDRLLVDALLAELGARPLRGA